MNRSIPACMAALLLCVPSNAQDKPRDNLVRIQIEFEAVVSPISEDFIGFGYEKSAVAQPGFFNGRNVHLVQLYRTLSSRGLVRIGGNVSDHTRFEANGIALVRTEKETTVISRRCVEEFAGFLRATGWKAMWGLNLGTGSKEAAAEEALAIYEALGERLHSFEIGNEVDLLRRFKSYEDYYAAYRDYKAIIRKVVPAAVFSGPDVAGNLQWALNFAGTESKDMKLLTHHYYRTGARRPEATIEALLAPHSGWENTLQSLQRASHEHAVSFRINEVNSFYGGGKPGVSDTFASALWCLDYMFRLASYGCDGVNMETDINQLGWVSHYSPIFRDQENRLVARPEYYGMLAFSVAGKGELLKTIITPTEITLSSYATRDPKGCLWATLVNKDLAQETRIEFVLPKGCSKAEAYRLEAPSAASRDQVTLGGAAVSPEGTWSPHNSEKLTIKAGVASFGLPAASAVLVQFGSR